MISRVEFINDFFDKAIKAEKLCRAYLFTGSNHQAKYLQVKKLNQTLNCILNQENFSQNQSFNLFGEEQAVKIHEACGQCQSCRWIDSGEHPKTPIIIRAEESGKEQIKIETIRDLLEELNFNSQYIRLIVIDSADKLNKESATALLKSIEEARENTIFFLLSESRDKVLSTLISRAQVFDFADDLSQSQEMTNQSDFNFDSLSSKLEIIQAAEQLAAKEPKEIRDFLESLQSQYSSKLASPQSLNEAKAIIRIEETLSELRSFVRPKNSVQCLLTDLKQLELI
ncbi:MAG: hypothetical protein LW817_07680 [Candidatus Caenarcaniphilales bacterium]|jgi:DNA polymerase III delta prime subunit|nr:hypothetical protein [Candidatus Caenarcaniphilales bacterium]